MSTWDAVGGAADEPAPGTAPEAEAQQAPGPPLPGQDLENPDAHPPTSLWGAEADEDAYEEPTYTAEDWSDWDQAGSNYTLSFAGGYEDSYPEEHGYPAYAGEAWPYPAGAPEIGAYAPADEGRRPTKGRPSGPWPSLVMVTSVAVVVAAVALGVTSAKPNALTSSSPPRDGPAAGKPNTATTAQGHGAFAGGAGSSSAGGQTTGSTRPSGTKAPGATTSTPGPQTSASARHAKSTHVRVLAKNLIISPLAKHQLVETWLATDPGGLGLTAKDVAGTVRGEVYYGYDVSIATYFALAAFQPSPLVLKQASSARGRAELRAFQDTQYVFSLQTGSTWTELGIVTAGNCPGEWVPTVVLAVWGMCGLRPPAT